MFKVKLRTLIIMMVLLFLNETTQAMLKMPRSKTPASTEEQSQNLALAAIPNSKEVVVKLLDQQAEKWDYTDFNWVETYSYFSTYINPEDFIEATSSGYESIESLAHVLLNSDEFNSKTIDDARLFVYAVLSATYDYRIDSGTTKLFGFLLLQEAAEAYQTVPQDQLVSVTCTTIEPALGYADSLLSFYADKFILSSDMTKFNLSNILLNLTKTIEQHTKIRRIFIFQSELHYKTPTLQEILAYYPDNQSAVFSFLVNCPLQHKYLYTSSEGTKFMLPEEKLKQKISTIFIQLWQKKSDDNLAQLAIKVLGFNPLKDKSPADSEVNAPCAAQQLTGSSSVDWEKFELTFNYELANAVIQNFYDRFINVLNLNSLMTHLLERQVITPQLKNELSLVRLSPQEKNTDFLDIISASLHYSFDLLKKLLEIMEQYGSPSEQALARDVCAMLRV